MDPDYRMGFVFLLDFDVHTDLCRDSGCHKDLGLPFRMGRYFLVDLDVHMDPVLLPLVWESCLGLCFHYLLKAHPLLFHRRESPVLAEGCTLGAHYGPEHILHRKGLGNLVDTCKVLTIIEQPISI